MSQYVLYNVDSEIENMKVSVWIFFVTKYLII